MENLLTAMMGKGFPQIENFKSIIGDLAETFKIAASLEEEKKKRPVRKRRFTIKFENIDGAEADDKVIISASSLSLEKAKEKFQARVIAPFKLPERKEDLIVFAIRTLDEPFEDHLTQELVNYPYGVNMEFLDRDVLLNNKTDPPSQREILLLWGTTDTRIKDSTKEYLLKQHLEPQRFSKDVKNQYQSYLLKSSFLLVPCPKDVISSSRDQQRTREDDGASGTDSHNKCDNHRVDFGSAKVFDGLSDTNINRDFNVAISNFPEGRECDKAAERFCSGNIDSHSASDRSTGSVNDGVQLRIQSVASNDGIINSSGVNNHLRSDNTISLRKGERHIAGMSDVRSCSNNTDNLSIGDIFFIESVNVCSIYDALISGCIPVVEKWENNYDKYSNILSKLPIVWASPDFSDITQDFLISEAKRIETEFYGKRDLISLDIRDYPEIVKLRRDWWLERAKLSFTSFLTQEECDLHSQTPRLLDEAGVKEEEKLKGILSTYDDHPDPFLKEAWIALEKSKTKFDLEWATKVFKRANKEKRPLEPEELAYLLSVRLHRVTDVNAKNKFLKALLAAREFNEKSGPDVWSNGMASRVFDYIVESIKPHSMQVEPLPEDEKTKVTNKEENKEEKKKQKKSFEELDLNSPWKPRYPLISSIIDKFLFKDFTKIQVLEIGTAYGGLAKHLLTKYDGSDKILSFETIDPYLLDSKDQIHFKHFESQNEFDALYKWVCNSLAPFKKRCEVYRSKSVDAAESIKHASYHFIYLDGPDLLEDLNIYANKVDSKGVVVIPDYYDRVEMIDKWAKENNFSVEADKKVWRTMAILRKLTNTKTSTTIKKNKGNKKK